MNYPRDDANGAVDTYTLKDHGFEFLRGLIPAATLSEVQASAAELLDKLIPASRGAPLVARLSGLQDHDKDAFFRFCTVMGDIPPCHTIFALPEIQARCRALVGAERLYLVDKGCFFNRADVTRLQYDWHSEVSYYPNAREVATLWFPWLHDTDERNGTMVMAAGSHARRFEATRAAVPKGLTQMRIDEADLHAFEKVPCNLHLGDAVLFSAFTAHKTGTNLSELPRVSMILRFADAATMLNPGW